MPPKPLNYMFSNSTMTLQEGLHEYMTKYSHILIDNTLDNEKSRFFLRHDYTHILFGTRPFDLRGETLTDIWTLFGTDLTFCEYCIGASYVDTQAVINSYIKIYGGRLKTYLKFLTLFPDAGRTLIRCKKMTKKWCFKEPERYNEVALVDIRKEYGIVIL